MRRLYLTAAAALLAALMAVSCTKDPAAGFYGNYSFKCSAVLDVERAEQTINDIVVAEADQVTRHAVTESGQMDIVPADSDGSNVVITMNITGGGLVILNAEYYDGKLIIPAQHRHVAIRTGVTGIETVDCMLTVGGTARRLQDLVIFDLEYNGDYSEGSRACHISGSEVSFRAKLNED